MRLSRCAAFVNTASAGVLIVPTAAAMATPVYPVFPAIERHNGRGGCSQCD